MRYLVISPCEDVRTGKAFEHGDEFLPEPDDAQAVRLVNAGCLRVIPDDAPRLPGTEGTDALIADLREQLDRAGDTIVGLNLRLDQAVNEAGQLASDLKTAIEHRNTASDESLGLRGENEKLAARVADLEQQLDAATKPADAKGEDQSGASETAPAKTAKAKG